MKPRAWSVCPFETDRVYGAYISFELTPDEHHVESVSVIVVV